MNTKIKIQFMLKLSKKFQMQKKIAKKKVLMISIPLIN